MAFIKKTKIALYLISTSIMLAGCSNGQDSPSKPGFKDGSPPVPKTEISAVRLPEPLGLNKGIANSAIEKSILIAGDSLNINEKLRLKNILTGYNGFDQYVFEAQIRSSGIIEKVYADTGRYDTSSNQFVIDSEDFSSETKKLTVI